MRWDDRARVLRNAEIERPTLRVEDLSAASLSGKIKTHLKGYSEKGSNWRDLQSN
jgi:hypothetical protein